MAKEVKIGKIAIGGENPVEFLEKVKGKMTSERKTRDNRSYSGYVLYKNHLLNYGRNEEQNI